MKYGKRQQCRSEKNLCLIAQRKKNKEIGRESKVNLLYECFKIDPLKNCRLYVMQIIFYPEKKLK